MKGSAVKFSKDPTKNQKDTWTAAAKATKSESRAILTAMSTNKKEDASCNKENWLESVYGILLIYRHRRRNKSAVSLLHSWQPGDAWLTKTDGQVPVNASDDRKERRGKPVECLCCCGWRSRRGGYFFAGRFPLTHCTCMQVNVLAEFCKSR